MIEPYYSDKYVTIYHGDCRDILPELPKVDLVLTDPPYNVGKEDWDNIDLGEVFPLVKECMYDGSSIYIFSGIKTLESLLHTANNNFRQLNVLIWLYPNGMNRLVNNWQICYDPIYFGRKGDKHTFNTPRLPYTKGTQERIKNPVIKGGKEWRPNPEGRKMENVIVVPCLNHGSGAGERTSHPTQKPKDIINYLIEASSNQGNLILDPFLGSGTTCYCAKKLNRKSIGIEIEEKYCEIAANRCRQSVLEFGDIDTNTIASKQPTMV